MQSTQRVFVSEVHNYSSCEWGENLEVKIGDTLPTVGLMAWFPIPFARSGGKIRPCSRREHVRAKVSRKAFPKAPVAQARLNLSEHTFRVLGRRPKAYWRKREKETTK